MKNKLVKASLAGVAVLALAAGGGTFAAWSDFYVSDTAKVGADVLALQVDPSATWTFDDQKLAPGTDRDRAFFVATRIGDTIPAAGLTMTLTALTGDENGCDSNSEAFAESNGTISDKDAPDAPCNLPDSEGQFSEQTLYYVQAKKASDPSECNTSDLATRQRNTILADMNDVPVNLLGDNESLAGGEGVCVFAHIFMPNNVSQLGSAANNASQGDTATFKVRFDLTQL